VINGQTAGTTARTLLLGNGENFVTIVATDTDRILSARFQAGGTAILPPCCGFAVSAARPRGHERRGDRARNTSLKSLLVAFFARS
jgi:hypothetical protein